MEGRLKQQFHGPLLATSVTCFRNSWAASSDLVLIRCSLPQWTASPASRPCREYTRTYIPWHLPLPENKSIFKYSSLSLLNISPTGPLLHLHGHQSSPNHWSFPTPWTTAIAGRTRFPAYSLSSAPPTNSVFKTQACSCQALLNTHQWLCCFFFKSQIPYPVRSPAQAGLCPPLACHLAALGGPQTRCLPPGGLALPPSPTITWMAVLKPLLTSDSPSSQTTAQHLWRRGSSMFRVGLLCLLLAPLYS